MGEIFAIWKDSQGWHISFPDDPEPAISEQECRERIEHILEHGWEASEIPSMAIAERAMRAANAGLIVFLGLPGHAYDTAWPTAKGNRKAALHRQPPAQEDLVSAIRARFAPSGGVELERPPRSPMRTPP